MTDSLTRAVIRLFQKERFYAELVLRMNRIVSSRVPTAGVCIKDTIELHVNPEFFNEQSSHPDNDQQVAILMHECAHIFNDHIPRMKEFAPEIYAKKQDWPDTIINSAKHKVLNIAADLAINPGIPAIPEGGMFPKQFDLKDGETVEWYAENLKDNEKLKELTEFDGHSLWNESEGSKEELREKIKNAVKVAAEKTREAGKMTAENELLVDRFLNQGRDWKKDLSRFAARTIEVALESSKKKRNRRYGIMYPGIVKIEQLHIGVALDTSGSISDEALNQFMAEVANIAKYATVTVVEADTEVKASYLFDSKKTYKVKGRGGTAYQPAFDFFTEETDVDGVIYFGDMDCFDEILNKPKYPVMWAIIGNQAPPADWGSKTKVEIKSRS